MGERVFRSFHADGLLRNHDAEDPEASSPRSVGRRAAVALNARVAASDLVVLVHLVTAPERQRRHRAC